MDFITFSLSKKYVDNVISQLPKGISYKGAVDYIKDLPNSPTIGDAYTVKYQGSSGTDVDGGEYVWGTYEGVNMWIALGPDLEEYQKVLVSGTNIKTINNTSVLGSGDIALQTPISDLETIRSGAALGATALQSHQDISNKTDTHLIGTNGTALLFNETDGGGAKFEHNDGTWSGIAVNDGGANGIAGQIYAISSANTSIGTKINIEKDKITYIKNKATAARTADDELATKGDISAFHDTTKQDTLVSGTNIKTVHGNSLLGEGNVEIPTYSPFKSSWRSDTIAHLMADINADSDVVVGSSYLGEITTVTTSEGLFNGNAEIVVNVMRSHLYWCIISSNNVDPYHWEATFSGATISLKGWTPFVPGSRTIAGVDLKDNITKAELQTALADSTHRFITDGQQTYWDNAAAFINSASIASIFPLDANAADGTYTLKAYKVNGEVAYTWNSDTMTVTTYLVTKGTITGDDSYEHIGSVYIKVDEIPTSNNDYTYSMNGSVGTSVVEDIPAQFSASKLYIWGEGAIDSPESVDLSSYDTYDKAYELTLTEDSILSLTCACDV